MTEYDYITHVTYVTNNTPWPIRGGSVLVSGSWCGDRKIIAIEPYQDTGPRYSYTDQSAGLAVWWVERVIPNPAAPPQPELTDYERLREELQA